MNNEPRHPLNKRNTLTRFALFPVKTNIKIMKIKEGDCFPNKQGVIKHISYRYDYDPVRRSTHPYTVYELWVDGILKCKRTCGQIQKGSNTMSLIHNINQFKKLCRLFASKFTVEKSKVHLEFQAQK